MPTPADAITTLRTLAEKATPGPWEANHDGFDGRIMSVPQIPGGCRMEPGRVFVAEVRGWGHLQYRPDGEQMQEANRQWIAAANPAAIVALLDRLDAASAVCEAFRAYLDDSDMDDTQHRVVDALAAYDSAIGAAP